MRSFRAGREFHRADSVPYRMRLGQLLDSVPELSAPERSCGCGMEE